MERDLAVNQTNKEINSTFDGDGCYGENKAEKGEKGYRDGERVSIVNRVVGESLTEKVIFFNF